MPKIETVAATEKYRLHCEDRVAIFNSDDRTVIVVADGAGGTGSGDIAAETVSREVETEYSHIHSATQWCQALKSIDDRVHEGESTAVVVDLRPYGIAGASVGDSQAWIISSDEITDLTIDQNRKPLLGSGNSDPASFTHESLNGILLVGTDGLFDYADRKSIVKILLEADFCSIPRRCIEFVRLPSGDYWDDIGIVAARVATTPKTSRRYSI